MKRKVFPLRFKLTIIMASIIMAVIVLICVVNSTLFENYYINNRLDNLRSSFYYLTEVYQNGDSTEISDEIQQIYAFHNINTCVIDGNWTIKYTSQYDADYIVRLVQEIIFSNENNNNSIIEETDEYIILKGYDSTTALSFYEIYGTLNDGTQIIMQITVDSIEENITIFNRFVQWVGLFVLILGIIVVYFVSLNFTKPVKKISMIAERMSNLDFSARYEGFDRNEIGLLGQSMNRMADRLEKNISELKAANAEFKRDIELKDKNDVMRRDFLSNVSHELKTPIALIQGYAEGLKEGIIEDPESMQFYCEVIMDEANKMNNMVKKLLTLNQIEFGRDQINIEHFDMSQLISSVLKSNSIRFGQNGITLQYEDTGSHMVWCDQIQMEEVFTNYISNAINHCDNEKIIRVNVEEKAHTLYVSVFNSGNNIPEDDIEHIWEKFYKVDKARTREYGGNGIGLSIVKAILDNYNASYGADNHDDGVTFWFEIDSDNSID